MKRKLHFAVVAVDGTLSATVFGPIELVQVCAKLQARMPELEPCEITCEILSPDGEPFLSTSGYRLPVDGGLKELTRSTVIFLPGFGLPPPERIPELLERHTALGAWLKRQHQAGCTIVANCSGSFLLAEHGLLRRGKATTYWGYASLFRERYPDIDLDPDMTLVEDERVLTVGGQICGLDAILAIIERSVGQEFVRLCTKLLVMESRPPSQLRYEKRQAAVHNDPLVDKAVNWIRGHLHGRLTMNDLLRQVPTSRRSLSRRFKQETGEAVQTFIQRLRIDRAKLLLETSSLPVDQIVKRVGYHDASALTRQFKVHTKLTPNQYRQRYGLSRAPRTAPGPTLTSPASPRP
ncbi:MAG TPA: helix-turn-helix domain-containing protein [Steroidobacteraceae bacterium]|jgi:transcriptional regulator GlxA family with amidase domain